MKCSDVSTLLVDFLYEEMPAGERREFLAHVDGCASCSAEVKAMASTLGHARAALRGPLTEEAPAGVHARILQAAQAAAADKVPAAASAKPRPQPEGFFSRLWKTPWLVPALGAASVATVVLLVRVMKNPQVFPEQRPAATELLAPPPAEKTAAALQPRQQPEAEPALPSTSAPVLTKKHAAESDDSYHAEANRAAAKPRAAAPAPSNVAPAGRRLARSFEDFLDGADEGRARAPVGEAKTGKGGLGYLAPRKAPTALSAKQEQAPATPVEKEEVSRSHAARDLAGEKSGSFGAGAASSGRWAEPPPPRPAEAPPAYAPAPAAAAPSPARRPERVPVLEDQLEGAPQEPERWSNQAKTQAPARAPAPGPAAQAEAEAEAPADKKKVSENKDFVSFAERVRKAEKLFAEKKWAEAAAAFRALIAQAPANPAAKTWRERVAAAEAAQNPGLPAKAKKATSGDVLDGL